MNWATRPYDLTINDTVQLKEKSNETFLGVDRVFIILYIMINRFWKNVVYVNKIELIDMSK